MTTNSISMYKNDTKTITCTVTSGGTAKDLTDYTMKMTLKVNKADIEYVLQKTATISAPLTGVGIFDISSTDSALTARTYYYDVEIYNSTTGDKKTVILDTFGILQDLTT